MGLLTGVGTAYAGFGVLHLGIVALAVFRARGAAAVWPLAVAGAICLGITALTHLLLYPEWLAGYEARAARYALDPMYVSLFRLVDSVGVYHPAMPGLLMLSAATFAAIKALTGDVLAGLAIVTLGVALGRPENSYDIVVAALLPGFILMLRFHMTALVALLLTAAVGYRIGDNDNPSLLHIALMYVPVAFVGTWLLVHDVRFDKARG